MSEDLEKTLETLISEIEILIEHFENVSRETKRKRRRFYR